MPRNRLDQAITCIALLATAGCGFLAASPWSIVFGAVMIASLRSEVHLAFAEKYAPIGRVSVWAPFAGASIAGNTISCAIAFTLGRAIAGVV